MAHFTNLRIGSQELLDGFFAHFADEPAFQQAINKTIERARDYVISTWKRAGEAYPIDLSMLTTRIRRWEADHVTGMFTAYKDALPWGGSISMYLSFLLGVSSRNTTCSDGRFVTHLLEPPPPPQYICARVVSFLSFLHIRTYACTHPPRARRSSSTGCRSCST